MTAEILEHPAAAEIVQLVERQASRRRAIHLALEVAALSNDEFAAWYAREWRTLPAQIGSAETAYRLEHARRQAPYREFAVLRGWIVRELARRALQS